MKGYAEVENEKLMPTIIAAASCSLWQQQQKLIDNKIIAMQKDEDRICTGNGRQKLCTVSIWKDGFLLLISRRREVEFGSNIGGCFKIQLPI